ncbi:NAD-specific glutamate dehydrogenase [Pseudomonas sp. IT-P44]
MGAGGDLGFAVFEQLVATVEALVAQAEHVGLRTTVNHIQPLLTRVDEDVLHRLGHLRQINAFLLVGDFAGHHVLFAGQRQNIELRTGGTDQHQGRIGGVEADVLQRTARLVQRNRGFAVRIFDGRRDGLLAVRVTDFIGVTEHQRLTIGEAHRHQWMARLVFADGGHGSAGRNRQIDALEFGATVDVEKQCLPFVGNPHGDLVLFFQGDHQRLAGVLHPGGRDGFLGGQVGTLEQGQDDVGKEEEDQRDRAENGKAANEDVPAGQAIFERADAALALQLRRIEINSLGGICSHGGIGQIIHAHTLAILYDRKMTMQ